MFWPLNNFHIGQTRLELSLTKKEQSLMLVKEGYYLVIFLSLPMVLSLPCFKYDHGVDLSQHCLSQLGTSWSGCQLVCFSLSLLVSRIYFIFSVVHPFFLIKVKINDSTKSAPAVAVQILRSMPALLLPEICHKTTHGNFVQN